jgi:hypothetical protein
MTATQKPWTVKVVKSQRGGDGQWFRYPAAATFTDEAEAIAYAEQFAADQKAAGVTATRFLVLARKGDQLIREIKI